MMSMGSSTIWQWENYLLQVSRISLIGMRTFGVIIPEMKRILAHSTPYEYESVVADMAEAISDTLKPQSFFAAHAGGGEFICVLLNCNSFDGDDFNHRLNETITEMDLHYSNGAPMSLRAVVGDDFSLKLKSPKGVSQTLVQALAAAENGRTTAAAQRAAEILAITIARLRLTSPKKTRRTGC